MNLTIKYNLKEDLSDFIEKSLIPQMQEYFKASINDKRLIPFNEYLNERKDDFQFGMTENKKTSISVKQLLLECIDNLTFNRDLDTYTIEINSNKKATNLSAKLIYIAKLINYGNLLLAPYPIFDDMFNYFSDNISYLYNEYREDN